MGAWLESLSFIQVVALIFTVYWVGVLIWIKGTDPLSSGFWEIIWMILKFFLTLGVGFVVLAFLTGRKESR